jgi:hypothetical protein
MLISKLLDIFIEHIVEDALMTNVNYYCCYLLF